MDKNEPEPKEIVGSDSRDQTLPRLDKYLRDRRSIQDPGHKKLARIIGIDLHLPLLGLLEIISIALLILLVFFNLILNEDGEFIKGVKETLSYYARISNIYFYFILYLLVGVVIVWFYNFLNHLIIVLRNKPIKNSYFFPVIYWTLVLLAFIGYSILGVYYNFYLGIAYVLILILMLPIIMGVIGLLLRNRYLITAAIIGTFISTLIYQNDLDEIFNLVLFAAVAFLFMEVTDAVLKLRSAYIELDTEKDEYDNQLLSEMIGNYALILAPMAGFTVILTFIVAYSQTVLGSLLPQEITNSIEFNSPIFMVIPLAIIVFLILFSKWMVANIFVKFFSKQKS
jgi:hypothetical protein